MAFASGLTLADLSDYLAPSQACIMPVKELDVPVVPTEAEIALKKATSAAMEITVESDNINHSIEELGDIRQKLKKAEITIEDCLACSGCVTSEESVLVAMQSDEEVYRVLREQPELIPIISFSPQSLASLAALHDLSITETFRGLRAFFKRELGFKLVFDITFARSISLAENRREFLERKSHASSPSTSTSLISTLPPLSPSTSSTGPLPILSSACPGWICLAEKKHGELLPFVSNVKSAQAVMGTLVKGGEVAKRLNLKPQQIYHVSVMPCFDKKLEASRLDFSTPHDPLDSFTPPTTTGIRDVDCVLTTGEVQKMLNSRSLSLSDLANSPTNLNEEDDILGKEESSYFPELLFAGGTSSGGYLFNTIQAVLSNLSNQDLYNSKLLTKKLKNEDHISYTLINTTTSTTPTSTLPSSSLLVLFRAAKCYGLHNLQNLTRKVTTDASITLSPSTENTQSLKMSTNRSIAAAKVTASNAKRLAAKNLLLNSNVNGNKQSVVAVEEINYEKLPYDFVEVMACPSGCVNGGGQIRIPTEPMNLSRKKRKMLTEGLDEEGMPDFSEKMQVDEESNSTEGNENQKQVFTGKEWVSRVEEVYWEIGEGEGSHVSNFEFDWSRIDDSIKPYLVNLTQEKGLEKLIESTVESLVSNVKDEDKEERRRELLRTSYRIAEGQTNGFAVEW